MGPRWLSALGRSQEPSESWLDDRHCLVAEVGRGATSVVYRAKDRSGRTYALKVPVGESDGLLREARICQALDSPHVVKCLELCGDGSSPVLMLELLRGETLCQRLAGGGRLQMRAIERYVEEILLGLEAVHSVSAVHADLKPGNIFLCRRGRSDRVKLVDFGMAVREGETPAGGPRGTAVYAAPEQWGDFPLDRRCDLYALGVVVYEMATGLLPWSAEERAALLALKRHGLPQAASRYRTDFSTARDALLTDLLRPSAADRPTSVGEVRQRWREG